MPEPFYASETFEQEKGTTTLELSQNHVGMVTLRKSQEFPIPHSKNGGKVTVESLFSMTPKEAQAFFELFAIGCKA